MKGPAIQSPLQERRVITSAPQKGLHADLACVVRPEFNRGASLRFKSVSSLGAQLVEYAESVCPCNNGYSLMHLNLHYRTLWLALRIKNSEIFPKLLCIYSRDEPTPPKLPISQVFNS